jgi:hypothetical protein
MKEFELIKQLEYLTAFQNDCLNKGDWNNFDKTEESIKKIEEALINPEKIESLLKDEKLQDIFQSLGSVSSY